MSRKKKGNKPTSARGHVESNVIRWREEKRLIRIDKTGRPLNSPLPINTFDRNWLAQHLLDNGGTAPPVTHHPPRPDNVSDIRDHKKNKPKPKATSGNEAESLPPDKPKAKRIMRLDFLHNKAMAADEFRHWSRISKEIGRKCPVVWAKLSNGKLSSPDLELQRERSRNGHKNKLKFKSPPSTVHNPFVSGKPVTVYNQRMRQEHEAPANTTKPKNTVVYTTEWPFVKRVEKPAAPPPTAAKHWHGEAANDNAVAVRRMPDKDTLVFKMQSEVQWFINHVEPQNWPTHVHNFANWRSGGPIPNTGAINKAAADPATRERLMNALYQGLLEDWKMLDSALAMSNQEVNLLNQELTSERQANHLMEYDLAMRNGQDPDAVREAYIKPKTPDVPDDADVMVAQYRVYQSFVKCDGPEHAFARYVYGDPRLGDVIRDHADMRCAERQQAVEDRDADREYWNITLPAEQLAYEVACEKEYSDWWNAEYPRYLRQRCQRKVAEGGAVKHVGSESLSLRVIARKAAARRRVLFTKYEPSIYYSALDRGHQRNSAVVGALLSKIKPVWNYRSCEYKRNSYEKWWRENLTRAEIKYHESHFSGRVKIGVVRTYNKIVGTLNTPVDYGTRKRQRDALSRLRDEQHKIDERRERRKEVKAKRKEQRKLKQQLRQAYGIAH